MLLCAMDLQVAQEPKLFIFTISDQVLKLDKKPKVLKTATEIYKTG